jgi:hypothetical protein
MDELQFGINHPLLRHDESRVVAVRVWRKLAHVVLHEHLLIPNVGLHIEPVLELPLGKVWLVEHLVDQCMCNVEPRHALFAVHQNLARQWAVFGVIIVPEMDNAAQTWQIAKEAIVVNECWCSVLFGGKLGLGD